MVNFATAAAGAIPPSANEVVLEAPAVKGELRRQRVQHLREVIENGHYFVAAGDLADALLRAARQAN